MTLSRDYQFTLNLGSFPSCGNNSGGGGAPMPFPHPITDPSVLPYNETEALANCLFEWVQVAETNAKAVKSVPWSYQFVGQGNSDQECLEDAITQLFNALGPLLQVLAQSDVLDQTVTVIPPDSAEWIMISPGYHYITAPLCDEQSQFAAWEVPFTSPSLGQVWIVVCVMLQILSQAI